MLRMSAESFKSSHQWGARRERFNEIFELCLSGASLSEIGARYGISKQAVSSFVKKHANEKELELIQEAFTKKSPSAWHSTDIIAGLQAGMTCAQISKELNCHLSSVKRVSARWRKTQRESAEL